METEATFIEKLRGRYFIDALEQKNRRTLSDLVCERFFNIDVMTSDAQPGKKGIE